MFQVIPDRCTESMGIIEGNISLENKHNLKALLLIDSLSYIA